MHQSQKLAIHLDNLRIRSKITVEEFCMDVVDTRTYRRYKSGVTTLSQNKIAEFCKKLKISATDFYYTASEQDKYEFKRINDLYYLAINRDYKKFSIEAKIIKRDLITDIQNKRFYDFCLCKVAYDTHKKKDNEVIQILSEISNYPKCITHTAFDFVSIVSLQLIAEIEVKVGIEKALIKLLDILSNDENIYTSSENNTILPSVYSNVAIYLLRLHKYQECSVLSEKGISYSKRFSNHSGLSHLYYSKSFSLLKLGKKPEAEKNAVLCILSAIIKDNSYELKMFKEVLTKDFGIDPIKLLDVYKHTLIIHE